MIRKLTVLWLLACAPAAQSAEILSIQVDSDEGVYTMTSEVWFEVPVAQIYKVYRYWDYAPDFSSAIVEARDMEPDGSGRPQFYIRNKGCVLFFCKSFERQGYIESLPMSEVRAFANPDTSDFIFSNESWRFLPRDGGTIVTYDLVMKPKFWVPPGIGPYLIKRKLKNNGGDAVNRIEKIAQGLAGE
ncbi:MAG TPA: hypothetical protein PKH39_00780 [Woeseiaceae bacterium]|nr:hypothetical protein [Woeseiaceae bacterium]